MTCNQGWAADAAPLAGNLWLSWAMWGIISQNYVQGVQRNVLPDGTKGIGLALAGRHQLNEMWCTDGKCE